MSAPRWIVTVSAALLLSACASIPTPASLPTLSAGEELYVVNPSHSFPYFEISHLGFSTHRGRFNKTSGWIVLQRATHSGSMELTIDTDSIDTGDPTLEQRLREGDFFDSKKYPTMTFKSNNLRFEGDKLVGVDGELTIRGVTQPVTLKVTAFTCGQLPLIRTDVCGADAETRIKRADFGMTAFSSMLGGEVRLLIQIEAHRR
ncbi:MAG TPA: YceI family protein [Burkholderiaceae bacterium]|nr:YceI family protein [Burkholderiaceae bacterium]